MKTKDAFWDKTADKYAADPIADLESYETKLERTRGYFTPQTRVLEIGCGTGSTALLHAPFVKHIHAIDFSQRMIEIAREKQAKEGIENITFEVGDVEQALAGNAKYDVVMAMSLLHLVDDRQALIRQVYDLLEPGGHFVSSTVCLGDGAAFFKPIVFLGTTFLGWPRVSFFKAKQLTGDIEAAGFSIVHAWCPGPRKAHFLIAQKPA